MKKLSKFIYFIFAFALITCMAIFNPAISSVDAQVSLPDDNTIAIYTGKISGTVEAGQNLLIPMPTVKNASADAVSQIEVKDRSGYTYTYNCKDGKTYKDGKVSEINYFTLLKADKETVATTASEVAYIQPTIIGKGSYTIQYKVVDGAKTYYGDTQTVQVKGVAYSWEFAAENTAKNIIPATSNGSSEYVLPLPKIMNTLDAENPTVAQEYTTADLGTNIIITRGGVDVSKIAGVTRVDDGKIYFTPTLEDLALGDSSVANGSDSATYIIKYKSKISAFADRSYTVKVTEDYNTKAELEVSHNSITNVQSGAVTTLPTPNVTDKTHNKSSVEVNTVITIKKGNTAVKLEPNQFEYTFTETGDHTIYYEVEDAYGNKATSAAYSFKVTNSSPYLVTYADSYETTGDNWEDEVVTGVDYIVPSEVGYGGFWLPAIYAEDYVTSYEDMATNKWFSRKLVLSTDSSVYFDIDSNDAEHGNAAYDANKSYNDKVFFQFPGTEEEIKEKYAGATFKLEYTARGENDSPAYATTYTIKVADVDALSYNVDKNLIINFPSINDTIDPNAELKFTSASAKEEPTNSELVADERVEVRTYYYYGDKTEIENAVKTHIENVTADYNSKNSDTYNEKYGYNFDEFITTFTPSHLNKLTSKDGYTTLKLNSNEYTNQSKVTVFAVAINDQNQFVVKAREIAIDNTSETGTPTIVSAVNRYTTGIKYDQNALVELPTVSFTDDIDKRLEVEVRCYVDTPDQTVGVTINRFIEDTVNNRWGIEIAELTTTYAGTYYVIYTATDDAGNKVSYVSTFEVANTEKAEIDIENGANITANIGEEVVLNLSLTGKGEYTNVVYNIAWGENKPSGLGSQPNSFKFNKAGTYTATVTATYMLNGTPQTAELGGGPVTITINEPEMEWEDGIDELLANRTANLNEKIELPVISVSENGVEINATPKVVFTDKNGKETEVEVKFDEENFNNYYFTAEKDGVYTVTYTATTDYNSDSKSFTVTCGDYYDPTIIIDSNKLQDSKITYNGQDITLNVKSFKQETVNDVKQDGKYILTIVATEGEKELFSYDIKVSLKDMDTNKATVDLTTDNYSFELSGDAFTSEGTNTWAINGVGNYELKLTVKDANGNATTKSINFSVVNKSEPKSVKDNVVGIVLIVVSVVILGGVILFFALAGKRNKSRRKTVKTENKD